MKIPYQEYLDVHSAVRALFEADGISKTEFQEAMRALTSFEAHVDSGNDIHLTPRIASLYLDVRARYFKPIKEVSHEQSSETPQEAQVATTSGESGGPDNASESDLSQQHVAVDLRAGGQGALDDVPPESGAESGPTEGVLRVPKKRGRKTRVLLDE